MEGPTHDNNVDCHRCSFGGLRSQRAECGNHGDLSADEVSQQFRQGIVFAFQPVVLDRHVLALYVPGFAESLLETTDALR
jgi:hypothetical protein